MSNSIIQSRGLKIKAGMTPEYVIKSKDASQLQKKYASSFDIDGVKGYSQEEADIFNSTSISEREDGNVVFWRRHKDGRKTGSVYDSDNKSTKSSNDGRYTKPNKSIKYVGGVCLSAEMIESIKKDKKGNYVVKLVTGEKLTYPEQKGNQPSISLTTFEDIPVGDWKRDIFNAGLFTHHKIKNMNNFCYTASKEASSCVEIKNCNNSTIDLKANYSATVAYGDVAVINGGKGNKVTLNDNDYAKIDGEGRLVNEGQYISIEPVLKLLNFFGIKTGITIPATTSYGSTITQEEVAKNKEIIEKGLVIEY